MFFCDKALNVEWIRSCLRKSFEKIPIEFFRDAFQASIAYLLWISLYENALSSVFEICAKQSRSWFSITNATMDTPYSITVCTSLLRMPNVEFACFPVKFVEVCYLWIIGLMKKGIMNM